MTMTVERSGSCSTTIAALDVEEGELEDLTAFALALAEVAEEVLLVTGNHVLVKQFKKVAQKDDRDH
jgi:predicted methyltransferase